MNPNESSHAASKPPRYRLYIDESGDHTCSQLDAPSRRYLALLGVWFRQDPDYIALAHALENFKRSIFGSRPNESIFLHRFDIINRRGPYWILREPEARARFDEGLIDVISSAQFRLICVVVDKLEHRERYGGLPHPYHYCLAEMLRRYAEWLDGHSAVGDVMAETRYRAEDRMLMTAYQQIFDTGELVSDGPRNRRVLTSRSLKFESKAANVAGLQLADLLAHPVKQSMLARHGMLPAIRNTFGSRLVWAVRDKFHRDEMTGERDGYGETWLPK
jgi:hypothetical protein